MKVLVACEESQIVCNAFRERGHLAFSCDIIPCSGGHPEWHIQRDIIQVIYDKSLPFLHEEIPQVWNLLIAHPPCERLTCAANKYYLPKYSNRFPNIHKEREKAVEFFMLLVNAPIDKICIENPIGIMSTRYRKPDCIIQPYQFGHAERKSTCLWLKNLSSLIPTEIVKPDIIYHKSGRTDSRLHYETLKLPTKERRIARSKTFQGIADAMAEQWG